MSIIETPGIPTMSNPADRKKLRGMLEEIVNCLRRMDDEKIQKKIILDEIKSQFNIPTKHANNLAKTMFKDNFDEVAASAEDFETLYETIVKSSPSPVLLDTPDSDSDDE
jgi:hypothetical protein